MKVIEESKVIIAAQVPRSLSRAVQEIVDEQTSSASAVVRQALLAYVEAWRAAKKIEARMMVDPPSVEYNAQEADND